MGSLESISLLVIVVEKDENPGVKSRGFSDLQHDGCEVPRVYLPSTILGGQ